MFRGMRASRLSALKDSVFIAVLLGSMGLFSGLIRPLLQAEQVRLLEEQYLDEQRRVVAQTVINAGVRVASLRRELLDAGATETEAEAAALRQLDLERFGVNGYGYFYSFGEDWVVKSHPYIPELVGRHLDEVSSADGAPMGELFREALGDGDAGFMEYRWTMPGMERPDRKIGYVLRVPSPPLIIASGFYFSDLRESLTRFAELSEASSRRYGFAIGAAMAFLSAFLVVLAALSLSRIRATEGALARQLRSLERYKLILDESSMVTKTDMNGVITYVNDAFCEVTGYAREAAIGHNQSIERHPDTPREAFIEMWSTIQAGSVWRGVLKNRKADGSSYYKRATIVPIVDESGGIEEYISSGQDITELIEKRRELEEAFLTDSLTGLGNRLHLLRAVEKCPNPCVALLDIEGFSGINRAFGQAVGDEVLRGLAGAVLGVAMGRGWEAYRVQADTFAVLAPGTEPAACAAALAERLKDLRVMLGGKETAVITRVGLAAGREAFVFADAALKRAKAGHRPMQIFDPSETGGLVDPLGNLAVLRTVMEAVEGDGVIVAFQPIVDVRTRRVEKYECLMRLRTADGGVLMPDAFLDISKKTALYRQLTTKVIAKAIGAFRGRACAFSINLTIDDLLDEETIDFLIDEARTNGVAGRLVVEIVESEELRDFEGAIGVLARLREVGIRVAVDDFGSGYSSFEYLLKLTPEFVKLDRAIVHNLLSDDRAAEMVRSVVSFAKTSGMKTIAEFIDSEELLAAIRELGVDYAQGWLFGKAEERLGEA